MLKKIDNIYMFTVAILAQVLAFELHTNIHYTQPLILTSLCLLRDGSSL